MRDESTFVSWARFKRWRLFALVVRAVKTLMEPPLTPLCAAESSVVASADACFPSRNSIGGWDFESVRRWCGRGRSRIGGGTRRSGQVGWESSARPSSGSVSVETVEWRRYTVRQFPASWVVRTAYVQGGRQRCATNNKCARAGPWFGRIDRGSWGSVAGFWGSGFPDSFEGGFDDGLFQIATAKAFFTAEPQPMRLLGGKY
jgi:hypothetical protein